MPAVTDKQRASMRTALVRAGLMAEDATVSDEHLQQLIESCGDPSANQAQDELPADFVRAPGVELLALDRAPLSMRSIDGDGRLHVRGTNISKACVNEYLGQEIPGCDELGLEPTRLYRLWRHPDELKKAVNTFHRIPVLDLHEPVEAKDHKQKLVIGTTGSDAYFEAPYLKSSIAFWTQGAIDDIDADERKELSSAYRYRADMTPGVTPEGELYDGVMRDIVGNHVALVKQGRAGPDVVVGDSMESLMAKTIKMTRFGYTVSTILASLLKPKMAADAALDTRPILAKLTIKNFAQTKPKLLEAIKPKLAKDAKAADIAALVDALEKNDVEKGDEEIDVPVQPSITDPLTESMDSEEGGIKAYLKGKLSEEDYAEACKMLGGANDEDDKDDDDKKDDDKADVDVEVNEDADPDKDDDKDDDKKEKPVDKKAMDAAIQAAVARERENNKAVREAEEFVRPWVGKIAIAQDSALGVYQTALDMLGVKDAKKIDSVVACRAVLEVKAKPGDKTVTTVTRDDAPAMDAAAVESFQKRFPGASRISLG
jgi:hypothetical protein